MKSPKISVTTPGFNRYLDTNTHLDMSFFIGLKNKLEKKSLFRKRGRKSRKGLADADSPHQ